VPRRLALFLSVFLAAAGCARHETLVESGNRDQVLHFGNKDEPSDMDPQISTASPLTSSWAPFSWASSSSRGTGRTVLPGVADRWTVSPNGLTYTFHIRDGAKWSNGAP
jgi:oligopeptide transport system substrate-binding protein